MKLFNKFKKRPVLQEREQPLSEFERHLESAKALGLFDLDYYQAHCGEFVSEQEAFADYLEKSCFSNVNPSANFDTEAYMRSNLDVYHEGGSPLLHYIYHGRADGRRRFNAIQRWQPKTSLVANETKTWQEQSIAICLHIYYPDFIQKFAQCLAKFPSQIDVFVTCATAEIKDDAHAAFAEIDTVDNVFTAVVPNRGRNFGPFLVEFSQQLLEYDLMCHMHSKKSLYSGREQTQWFDYLNQYLFKDTHVMSCLLRLFDEHQDLGMYYPTSFWMMPGWVNHWTVNRRFAQTMSNDWDISIKDDFVSYPVGGMFWARPSAIKQLLERNYSYDDFPQEPLPNDGSELHALERMIGLLVEKNEYQQFFYHPPSAKFTVDKSYRFINYYKPPAQFLNELKNFDIVSFDVFDTVLCRQYLAPDYAKYKVGEYLVELEIVTSPAAFIVIRNRAEAELRIRNQHVGDVSIIDVYQHLSTMLDCDPEQTAEWMAMEFDFDMSMIEAKTQIVSLIHQLSDLGRQIWFISDTYYTKNQMLELLRHVGISIDYRLFISSDLQKRKDNGQMWLHIQGLVGDLDSSFIHVGDNVHSDAQLCGDYGLTNMHILHPKDKWLAAGLPFNPLCENSIIKYDVNKWGGLMSRFGRYPFFGN